MKRGLLLVITLAGLIAPRALGGASFDAEQNRYPAREIFLCLFNLQDIHQPEGEVRFQ
jgi:hypothetical protein